MHEIYSKLDVGEKILWEGKPTNLWGLFFKSFPLGIAVVSFAMIFNGILLVKHTNYEWNIDSIIKSDAYIFLGLLFLGILILLITAFYRWNKIGNTCYALSEKHLFIKKRKKVMRFPLHNLYGLNLKQDLDGTGSILMNPYNVKLHEFTDDIGDPTHISNAKGYAIELFNIKNPKVVYDMILKYKFRV